MGEAFLGFPFQSRLRSGGQDRPRSIELVKFEPIDIHILVLAFRWSLRQFEPVLGMR